MHHLTALTGSEEGGETMVDSRLSSQRADVRAGSPPPEEFDPLQADERELVSFGYPPRPDPEGEPESYSQWRQLVTLSHTRTLPEFKRNTDIYNGPAQLPTVYVTEKQPPTSNDTSRNWSGSVLFGAQGSPFLSVYAEWTVPDPEDPQAGQASYRCSTWVGIDGWHSPDVLQAGTSSVIESGVKRTYAWLEWFPDHEIEIPNFHVSAGDTMNCTVISAGAFPGGGSPEASIWIWNSNTDQVMNVFISPPAGTVLQADSAESIVETPSVNGVQATLPDYGVVYFDKTRAVAKDTASNSNFNLTADQGVPVTLTSDGTFTGKPLSVPKFYAPGLIKVIHQD